jgi:hypothetical protein
MCNFQSLYFNDDGYVVRCKECGHYQVAFSSTMLTLTSKGFAALCKLVKNKCSEADYSFAEHTKSVVIPSPAQGLCMLLTRKEAERFCEILEEADTEATTQSLLNLFTQ